MSTDDKETAEIQLTNKQLGTLVNSRHPEYTDEQSEHWEFLNATYQAKRSWFKDNIFKYYKEGSSYDDRVKRAIRYNHTKEVVDLVDKYLWRGDVVRNKENAPDCLTDFWKNYDRKGSDVKQLAKSMSTKSSIVGRIWVVIDNNLDGSRPVTVAEEKEMDVGNYAYLVMPWDVLNMSYDEFGDLNWILIREVKRRDENPFNDDGKLYNRYRLWTKNDWCKIEEKQSDGTNQSPQRQIIPKPSHNETSSGRTNTQEYTFTKGSHGLGKVPVTYCDHNEIDEKYTTPGLINDIAYIDRSIANDVSNLDAIINDQTFSQLIIPYQAFDSLPGQEAKEEKVKEMGTRSAFTYDGAAMFKPEYIFPDASQGELILTNIKGKINEIYHSLGLAGERTKQDNAIGIDNSSGVAKAYDFERVNAMLVSKAAALDAAEKRIAELVCLYHGESLDSEDTDYIKYPEDFDIRGLADEFDIAANLMLLDFPDLIRRDHGASVVDKIFPRASKEKKAEYMASLEEYPRDPMELIEKEITAKAQATAANGSGSEKAGIKQPSKQGQNPGTTK